MTWSSEAGDAGFACAKVCPYTATLVFGDTLQVLSAVEYFAKAVRHLSRVVAITTEQLSTASKYRASLSHQASSPLPAGAKALRGSAPKSCIYGRQEPGGVVMFERGGGPSAARVLALL